MSEKNTQRFFFQALFQTFDVEHLDYAVLHSWQTLPHVATSDVDIMLQVSERDRLAHVLRLVVEKTGWRLVQKLWYDVPWCFYYVFVSPSNLCSVALDFMSDPTGLGAYQIKDELVLRHKVRADILFHLSTEMELAYKLAKRRVKGIFSAKDREFVFDYYARSDKTELLSRMRELLPESFIDKALMFCEHGASVSDWQALMAQTSPAFRFAGRRWRIRLHPMWFLKTLERIVFRLRYATGYIFTVTRKEDIPQFPPFVFRRVVYVHGRVSLFRRACILSSATLGVQVVTECEKQQKRKTQGDVLNVLSGRLQADIKMI